MHFYQINPTKIESLNQLVDSLYNCQLIKSKSDFWKAIKGEIEDKLILYFPITIKVPGSTTGSSISIVLSEGFFVEFDPAKFTGSVFIKQI